MLVSHWDSRSHGVWFKSSKRVSSGRLSSELRVFPHPCITYCLIPHDMIMNLISNSGLIYSRVEPSDRRDWRNALKDSRLFGLTALEIFINTFIPVARLKVITYLLSVCQVESDHISSLVLSCKRVCSSPMNQLSGPISKQEKVPFNKQVV